MSKKLMVLGALVLAAVGAASSMPAQAQAPGYYFVTSCGIPSPRECPGGPSPIWFGPYSSYAQCDAAVLIIENGPFGAYPRSASSCYQQ